MKADTFGLPVSSMKTSEAASLGAAILGGISIDAFKDAHQAVESMVHIQHTYMPNEKQSRVYQQKYGLYKQLYPALKRFNNNLCSYSDSTGVSK
jgi:xylulokinase